MQLRSGARVKAPIVGPQPGCDGTSHSVLLRGLVGGVGSPVQTAPPEWSGLSSNISPSGHTDGQFLTGAVFNLINNTSHAIPLDPCPAYSIAVSSHQNIGPATAISGGILPGCTGSQAIPSGQALRFTLANLRYAFANNRATSGSSLTVTVVIAGLPAATAQVPVP